MDHRVKVAELLIVLAVLLGGGSVAARASAPSLTNATVSVACQTSQGQVCVHLVGDIGRDNEAVNVVFDLFGGISPGLRSTPVDEITFKLPAFDSAAGASNHFDEQICFRPISGPGFDPAGFRVQLAKITNAQGQSSDLSITTPSSTPIKISDTVGSTGHCSLTNLSAGPPAPTPVALAQTGGFDFRFPLIGLVLLIAGCALSLISASRRRSARRSAAPR